MSAAFFQPIGFFKNSYCYNVMLPLDRLVKIYQVHYIVTYKDLNDVYPIQYDKETRRKMSRRPPRTNPDPIDKYVGSRVRARRVGMRISQTKLGDAIGVTFQQVQKYENGTNRIGASNLYKISRNLSCEVSFFFQDISDELFEASNDDPYGLSEPLAEPFESDPMASREAISLVHDFHRIPDDQLRQRMSQFMRALANSLTDTPHEDLEESH